VTAADWSGVVTVAVLVVLAGVMAASEVAITRMNRVRAYRLQEEGERGSSSLVRIVEHPPKYLNVILLLTLLFHLGGTTIATVVAVRVVGNFGEVVATGVMTILLFVLAEVSPKTYVIQHTDRAALRLAPLIVALGTVFDPLARALIKIANVIIPGRGLPEGPFATEEDIKAMAEVASDEKEIEEEEKELIHSIFEFGDTVVREVMTPEPDIVALDVNSSLDEVLDTVVRHGFSRIPVYRERRDDIVGIVYAKDVLREIHALGDRARPLEQLIRKPHFVPESKKVADLLRDMQREKFHVAIVVDEFGAVAGLVTLEDLLEEIVGEIVDEYDREEPQVEPAGDGRYRVNARLPVDELNELLDAELPNEEWDTVGGLMMGILGRLPAQGEPVEFQDLRFTAERVQGRRISKVLVEKRTPVRREQADGGDPEQA
jgi:CBS domain containing-hemolysin-like protein